MATVSSQVPGRRGFGCLQPAQRAQQQGDKERQTLGYGQAVKGSASQWQGHPGASAQSLTSHLGTGERPERTRQALMLQAACSPPGLLVAGEPIAQEPLPLRGRVCRPRILPVRAVLDAPTAPFPKRVVAPVPPIGFKNVNEVPQVPSRAVVWGPANSTEFPDVKVNMVALLKGNRRLERFLSWALSHSLPSMRPG